MGIPVIGTFWSLSPGRDGDGVPEHWPPSLAGMRAALKAAKAAPRDGVTRTVSITRGRTARIVCTARDGRVTWPEGSAVVTKPQPETRKGTRP